MEDPDDVPALVADENRTYSVLGGSVYLDPARRAESPRLRIHTVGRDAAWVSSPEIETWVRGLETGDDMKEVWTGLWDVRDEAARDRVRRAMAAAGARCTHRCRSEPPLVDVREAWAQFGDHPRRHRFRVSWTAQTFEAEHRPDPGDIELFMARSNPNAPLPPWEAWVESLPASIRRDRYADDRETRIRLPTGHPGLPHALDPALEATDQRPNFLTITYLLR